jgi:hypothetical protein
MGYRAFTCESIGCRMPRTWQPREITTEDIDCWRGETRLVSIRRHDKNGVPLGSYHYETPQPPERILSFYQSPLAEFCRGEHVLTTLAGGKERWLEVAAQAEGHCSARSGEDGSRIG